MMPREVGDIPDTRAAALGSHHPSRRAVRRRTPTPCRYSSPGIRGWGVAAAPALSLPLLYFSASYFFSSVLDVRRPLPSAQNTTGKQRSTRRPARPPRQVPRTPSTLFDCPASTSVRGFSTRRRLQNAPATSRVQRQQLPTLHTSFDTPKPDFKPYSGNFILSSDLGFRRAATCAA